MFTPTDLNPRRRAHPLALVASLLLALAAPLAQAAYTFNADGTVTDTTTGLVWDRCVLGRSTTTTACDTGSATTFTWANALAQVVARNTASHLGFTDWRLPNVNELESLISLDRVSPAIDTTAFPNTPTNNGTPHLSATTVAATPAAAWGVEFGYGEVQLVTGAKSGSTLSYARLVRGGTSPAAFDALPPADGACGTVHATTPLVTSAPSANLCSTGTAGSVTTGNSAYTWGCAGSNGGGTASCSASRGYTVTPSAGANGSISPSTPQVVGYNATPAFTLSPSGGYTGSASGCSGTLNGSTYTTGAVTADCAVAASFALRTNHTAPSPGGGGNISTALSGGGATCGLQTVGYQAASAVGAAPPAGVAFPQGVVNFTTTNSCTVGGTITVTLTYPSAVPAGAQFYKYGPATAGQPSTWYVHPATIAGNTITYSVTDNGQGDSNAAVGQITDPGGPGVLAGGAGIAGVPALSQWALLLLAGLMALVALLTLRRRLD